VLCNLIRVHRNLFTVEYDLEKLLEVVVSLFLEVRFEQGLRQESDGFLVGWVHEARNTVVPEPVDEVLYNRMVVWPRHRAQPEKIRS
jgi:hypothetical protein